SPEITADAPTVTTSPEITTSPESTSPLTPDDLSVTSGRIDKQVDGKGWFSVTADWSVVSVDGDSVNVRIYLSVTCYSMQIGTRDCTATVVGVQYPFESDPISIPYTGKKQTMLIGSVAVKVPLSGSALRVDFPFKGTYSGVYYGTVTLEGLIDFN
ncbi:MAG: hypothetical protein J6V01_02210, partial [Clostridia bacterium]|nr:hypothetical protein [Clostridia bacterium]